MALDPLRATDMIEKRYIDYIKTTFAFKDEDLQNQLIGELKDKAKLKKRTYFGSYTTL